MQPAFTTRMRSASRIVLSRCATVNVVRPALAASSACWTCPSEPESRAEVASSRSSTCGPFARARAMAMRCFCPPDSWPPP
mmetsp:Transcript_31839/g.94647  ORF Transcript_31839/g.94647 Transcript_31839/m.94647 type:complete len:81 (+) Transcript_31839:98-340(+)